MPPKDMPKEVSIMGGCPVPNLCSPLLVLAEVEAEGKAKKARLRAQQRGRVAKGKKGRLRATLRHLWGKTKSFGVCRPRLGSRHRGPFHPATLTWGSPRKFESGQPLRPVPPKEEKG